MTVTVDTNKLVADMDAQLGEIAKKLDTNREERTQLLLAQRRLEKAKKSLLAVEGEDK